MVIYIFSDFCIHQHDVEERRGRLRPALARARQPRPRGVDEARAGSFPCRQMFIFDVAHDDALAEVGRRCTVAQDDAPLHLRRRASSTAGRRPAAARRSRAACRIHDTRADFLSTSPPSQMLLLLLLLAEGCFSLARRRRRGGSFATFRCAPHAGHCRWAVSRMLLLSADSRHACSPARTMVRLPAALQILRAAVASMGGFYSTG